MRAMGLDVGDKTVGVAVTDELGITVQPVTTLRRGRLDADLDALLAIGSERNVEVIVVGLPLNMNGTSGPRADKTRKFAEALQARASCPVELWDERLTTMEADRILKAGDVKKQRRKDLIDQLAAQLILRSWLEAHSGVEP